jgi:hypothetical protein
MSCSSTHHLLDPAFKELITKEEKEFSEMFAHLLDNAHVRVRNTAAFRRLI